MNKQKTILLKKLIAGFFMSLFVLVFTVKFFHHHRYSPTIAKGIIKEPVFKSDCSICDYCFVKDSHHETATVQIELQLHISPCYVDCLSPFLTSVGLSSSDRGPPGAS